MIGTRPCNPLENASFMSKLFLFTWPQRLLEEGFVTSESAWFLSELSKHVILLLLVFLLLSLSASLSACACNIPTFYNRYINGSHISHILRM